jgi:hypothetical protein
VVERAEESPEFGFLSVFAVAKPDSSADPTTSGHPNRPPGTSLHLPGKLVDVSGIDDDV